MEQWAAAMFQGESRDEILTRNAAALGEVKAYERIHDLTFTEYQEAMKDD
jgi:hypothetical protein